MTLQRPISLIAIAGLAGLGALATDRPAAAEIAGEPFVYDVAGTAFEGYVARNTDLAETRGTVILIHDWDGLTDYEMRRAEMLAALGYTAFAVDLYGQAEDPQSVEEYQQLTGALYGDREIFRERLMGSLEAAADIPGATEDVVVLGYCFGGAAVLEMARAGAETAGFVSFHGGLGLPEGQDYSAVGAPMLLLHGSADPVSGMADLAALLDHLTEAGVEHDAQVFGGARHSFTIWGSNDYDNEADRGSWEALLAFLDEHLD
ncbi:MAG: dienelactone hydrolase family protein [Azospirillaceae bacterium]